MTKPKIISETPITTAEVKSEIDAIKKRDTELNFRTGKTEEYLQQFTTLSKKKSEELKKKLEDLNLSRIKPEHIIKIIDLLPKTPEEVKLIFQGQALTLTNESAKKIADTVKEFD